MAERIKTFLIEPGKGKQEIGNHPEKSDGDMFYHNGVAYRITSASKFMHNRKREQELRVTREG